MVVAGMSLIDRIVGRCCSLQGSQDQLGQNKTSPKIQIKGAENKNNDGYLLESRGEDVGMGMPYCM